MSNFLVIGDVHGESYWKKIIEDNSPPLIFFLGDYCDSHKRTPREIIDNMIEIFDYARKNPDTVYLLVGNHDFHYMGYANSPYSGYNFAFTEEYKEVLLKNKDLFNMAITIESPNDKILISHAGVTNTFLERNNLTVETLNDAWENTPKIFDFVREKNSNPYGDDIYQSPIWVRPEALMKDMVKDYHQIVGHTYVRQTRTFEINEKMSLNIICSHDENNFAVW